MPETRYIEEFTDGKLTAEIPYEVSDEELQAEAADARLKEIANMSPQAVKVPELAEAVALICKKLGYS